MTVVKLTTEALDELSDDALALIAVEWADEGRQFLHGATLARYELEKRMEQQGATQLDTENWTGVLKSAGYDHMIEDNDGLRDALVNAGVDAGKINTEVYVIPPVPQARWNHRALNELHKLGGAVAAAIDQYRRATPKRRVLELKAKSE
jgi:hypothetical protein